MRRSKDEERKKRREEERRKRKCRAYIAGWTTKPNKPSSTNGTEYSILLLYINISGPYRKKGPTRGFPLRAEVNSRVDIDAARARHLTGRGFTRSQTGLLSDKGQYDLVSDYCC